jgi:hypothetical protein
MSKHHPRSLPPDLYPVRLTEEEAAKLAEEKERIEALREDYEEEKRREAINSLRKWDRAEGEQTRTA